MPINETEYWYRVGKNHLDEDLYAHADHEELLTDDELVCAKRAFWSLRTVESKTEQFKYAYGGVPILPCKSERFVPTHPVFTGEVSPVEFKERARLAASMRPGPHSFVFDGERRPASSGPSPCGEQALSASEKCVLPAPDPVEKPHTIKGAAYSGSYFLQAEKAAEFDREFRERLEKEGIRPDGDGPLSDSYSVTMEQHKKMTNTWSEMVGDKSPKVTINGRTINTKDELTYEELIELAGFKEGQVPTLIYHNADQPKSKGTLVAGESVKVKTGTVFDIVITGEA